MQLAQAQPRDRTTRTEQRVGLVRLATTALAIACVAAATTAVAAEPMDLRNPEARWVSVRFEVSPHDRPGQVDATYSAPIAARLEPDERGTRVLLTIPGRAVEEQLLRAHDPVPGSFSDFVWAFDAATGHVLSATLSGIVVRMLDWGLARSRMEARVRFQMDTRRPAGFRRARRLLGQRLHPYCSPGDPDACQPVQPRPYDPASGYVNAVGRVDVETRLLSLQTFSTLGEAIFSELEPFDEGRVALSDATCPEGPAAAP